MDSLRDNIRMMEEDGAVSADELRAELAAAQAVVAATKDSAAREREQLNALQVAMVEDAKKAKKEVVSLKAKKEAASLKVGLSPPPPPPLSLSALN